MDPLSFSLGLVAGGVLALALGAVALRARITRLRIAEERARRALAYPNSNWPR